MAPASLALICDAPRAEKDSRPLSPRFTHCSTSYVYDIFEFAANGLWHCTYKLRRSFVFYAYLASAVLEWEIERTGLHSSTSDPPEAA